jgi:hypothetical protein
MIALVICRSSRPWQPPLQKREIQPVTNAWQRIVLRLVDWLTEPIDFPGKWPNNEGASSGYNKDERQFDERRAAQS